MQIKIPRDEESKIFFDYRNDLKQVEELYDQFKSKQARKALVKLQYAIIVLYHQYYN